MKKKTPKNRPAKRKKIRILSFSRKIFLLCLLPMIIVCILISTYSKKIISDSVQNEIEAALKIVAASLDETYSNLYKGDYKTSLSGQVTKGDISISGDTELINNLKERTGYEMSLYFNDLRLITTLRGKSGAPANGTATDVFILEKVEKKKDVFLSGKDLFGKKYYVLYQPLINSDGSVAGVIEIAKDYSSVQKTINAQTKKITEIAALILLFVAIIIILLATKIVKVMKTITLYLKKLTSGDFNAVPKQKLLRRNDELGDIYRSSVRLQEEINSIIDNIKNSSSNLNSSADILANMAKDTRGSVDEVCCSMTEISDSSSLQAEKTSVAIDSVAKIREEILHISETMDSLTTHAHQMTDAEKTSEYILQTLNNSNAETITTISDVTAQLTQLRNSVEAIHQAISMIQSIADETDLLSINANIEAAKANEAGKGFAVVATQISKLAEQSTGTAFKVEKIIESIVKETEKTTAVMEQLKENINDQQDKLTETMNQSSAVSVGIHNSLADIQQIRKKIIILGESGNTIQDVIHNLAAISAQNENATRNTMNSTTSMSSTMNALEDSSGKLKVLANDLDELLLKFN